jgi:hypothetical protein
MCLLCLGDSECEDFAARWLSGCCKSIYESNISLESTVYASIPNSARAWEEPIGHSMEKVWRLSFESKVAALLRYSNA